MNSRAASSKKKNILRFIQKIALPNLEEEESSINGADNSELEKKLKHLED